MLIRIHWFRRDLRLFDNAALLQALSGDDPVVPIFIFDTEILNQLEDKNDRRVAFIHRALEDMQQQLIKIGSSIEVYNGTPFDVFQQLINKYSISAVYTNHDYEPYAIERDTAIANLLSSAGISFYTSKDQVIFEKLEVTKDDGTPYTVFTPYANKWRATLEKTGIPAYPSEKKSVQFFRQSPLPMPSLKSIGFIDSGESFPSDTPQMEVLKHYQQNRDIPSLANGTSRLGVHLRFGTISVRQLATKAKATSATFLNELIWRDFYMMILYHFPHVVNGAFKKQYDLIAWRNNEDYFKKWCEGKTGFPIVDAGMRELNSTGFMHNRVRMIVSSFLVKDLLIDWRWGEAYFAAKLNDFDLSANNGGWQWAAGTGCDAAPYFRVFNPTEQQKKFDPNFSYIKKWVPEFGTPEYVLPIVDHAKARLAAIQLYKNHLTDKNQFELFE